MSMSMKSRRNLTAILSAILVGFAIYGLYQLPAVVEGSDQLSQKLEEYIGEINSPNVDEDHGKLSNNDHVGGPVITSTEYGNNEANEKASKSFWFGNSDGESSTTTKEEKAHD